MAEPDQSSNENEIDQQPDDLQPEQAQEHADVSVAAGGERWPGWPGENVFRILVPAQKVGSIIGRKGEYIKKMCEETKARIKILDGPPGSTERAVMISAKEEPEASLPPAIDGLLRVHKRAVDGLDGDSSQVPLLGSQVSTRLLVPAAQAGNLIGKQGSTVKSIQEASNCIVRVLGTEDLPIFAFQDDRMVEVTGEPAATHKAIELIAVHLRKFLVDRSIIPIFEMQMQKPVPQMEYVPPNQSWGPPPQPFPPSVAGPTGYRINPFFGPPPRQHENYYSPVEMPPHLEKQPYQGLSVYNREAPVAVQSSSASNQAVQSLITQVTQQMVIPLSYADAVIGTDGASISYIRRVSGATVTIQENREVPGEMTAELSGSASQVQTAQQLIQNCIAEAAAVQNQAAAATDQGYNVYATQSSIYASAPSNPGIGGQTGGYGSVYGGNYGY